MTGTRRPPGGGSGPRDRAAGRDDAGSPRGSAGTLGAYGAVGRGAPVRRSAGAADALGSRCRPEFPRPSAGTPGGYGSGSRVEPVVRTSRASRAAVGPMAAGAAPRPSSGRPRPRSRSSSSRSPSRRIRSSQPAGPSPPGLGRPTSTVSAARSSCVVPRGKSRMVPPPRVPSAAAPARSTASVRPMAAGLPGGCGDPPCGWPVNLPHSGHPCPQRERGLGEGRVRAGRPGEASRIRQTAASREPRRGVASSTSARSRPCRWTSACSAPG